MHQRIFLENTGPLGAQYYHMPFRLKIVLLFNYTISRCSWPFFESEGFDIWQLGRRLDRDSESTFFYKKKKTAY